MTSTTEMRQLLRVQNTGAENTQRFRASSANQSSGGTTAATASAGAIDTAVDQTVQIEFELSDSADTMTLAYCTAKITYVSGA